MNTIPICDLRRQYKSLQYKIEPAIERVFRRCNFILGEEVKLFEEDFAFYLGVRYAIGVGNGTSALYLALRALNITGEVITAPNTSIFTICAIKSAGATPRYCDINENYLMDSQKLAVAITKNTAAIIPVHLYGQCVNTFVYPAHIKIIEDACQAHGAEILTHKAGSLGTCGCFSFYPTKNLGCYGDGGMITTNDEQLAIKLRNLRHGGGFNSRLDEIQAAILRIKLRYLDTWNDRRRYIANRYNNELHGVITPDELPFHKHVYHLYTIRVKNRDSFVPYMAKNGIQATVRYPYVHAPLPLASKYAEEIVCLPMFPELKEHEISKVIEAVNRWSA